MSHSSLNKNLINEWKRKLKEKQPIMKSRCNFKNKYETLLITEIK